MAEGLINRLLEDKWIAYSAGVSPSSVHPLAVEAMSEIGIDISHQRSKSVTEFLDRDDLDLVITVCGNARETCPVFFKPVESVHIGIEDPVSYNSMPHDYALEKFREVRNDIESKVVGYLRQLP